MSSNGWSNPDVAKRSRDLGAKTWGNAQLLRRINIAADSVLCGVSGTRISYLSKKPGKILLEFPRGYPRAPGFLELEQNPCAPDCRSQLALSWVLFRGKTTSACPGFCRCMTRDFPTTRSVHACSGAEPRGSSTILLDPNRELVALRGLQNCDVTVSLMGLAYMAYGLSLCLDARGDL